MAGRVWLMRHGHSLWQEGAEQLNGRDPGGLTDAGLSDSGWRQVRTAAGVVAAIAPDLIVSSPYTRALQTALAVRPPSLAVRVDPRAGERVVDSCDIGRAPGLLREEFPAVDFAGLEERWWYDGPLDERGLPVEPRPLVAARARALGEWLRAQPASRVLVVSHAGFIRRLVGRRVDNCELVEWDGEVRALPEDAS